MAGYLSRTLPVLLMEGVGWILSRESQESPWRGVLTFLVLDKRKFSLILMLYFSYMGIVGWRVRETGGGARVQTLL